MKLKLFLLSALIVSCDPKQPEDSHPQNVVPNGKVDDESGSVEIDEEAAANSREGGDPSQQLNDASIDMNFVSTGALGLPLADYGNMSAEKLESMKYLLQSIRLCEDDYNANPSTKCFYVYDFSTQVKIDLNYDTFGYCDAKTHENLFVDLMDANAIKRLSTSTSLTEQDIGTYRYGYVNWFRPFMIRGVIDLNDDSGTKLYTKDAPLEQMRCGTEGQLTMISKVSNITSPPAEDAVLFHNNGGSMFIFMKPLKITADDLKEKKKFQLDLTFNPDKLIQGGRGQRGAIWGTAGTYPPSIRKNNVCPYDSAIPVFGTNRPATAEEQAFCDIADGGYSIYAPMLNLTPVVHSASQAVIKETYIVHYRPATPVAAKFDIRVELYRLKDDSERGLYGVSLTSFYIPEGEQSGVLKTPMQARIKSDDSIEVLEGNGKPIFKNFKWLENTGSAPAQLIYVGGNGSCFMTDLLDCHHDPTWSLDVAMDYELESRVELSQ